MQVRALVGNYYDIQKLRVETYNRIVNWVRDRRDILIKKIESHLGSETQITSASQYFSETDSKAASRMGCVSHFFDALNLLKEKKYRDFVNKFVLKREAAEQIGIADIIKEIDDIIWFFDKLFGTEKELKKRLDLWSRDHPLRKEYLSKVKGVGEVLSSGIISMFCTERIITIPQVIEFNPETKRFVKKEKDNEIEHTLPQYAEVLEYDPEEKILKVKLPEVFRVANYVSKIWKYCGLAPGQRREVGKKYDYNPKAKTLLWKVVSQFVRGQNKFGKKLYDEFKEECMRKHPDWSKIHCHNWAVRKVMKLFIAALWEVWRKQNNLEVTKPYAIEHLEHKDIITPEMWLIG